MDDMQEEYSDILESRGKRRAQVWLCKQLLRSIGPAILFGILWKMIMIRKYVKMTFRTIFKHPGYALINIIGLAVGLTCCLFILLWVQDERSWDRFHEHVNELYFVAQTQPDGHITPVTPAPLAGILSASFPEIAGAARYRNFMPLQLRYGTASFKERPIVADPDFLKMLSFPLIQGEAEQAFDDRLSMVITETMARKFFDEENPIGKFLNYDNRVDFRVTGVIQDVPKNSTIQFDCILPFAFLISVGWANESNWTSSSNYTIIHLRKTFDSAVFQEKIEGIVRQHDPENKARLTLQRFADLHLRPQGEKGPKMVVTIMTAVAVFILIVACINFINLTTARSSSRAKEIGLRKTVGATSQSLRHQFFSESLVYTLLAAGVSLILIFLLFPSFNMLTGKSMTIGRDIFRNRTFVLGLPVITILTCLFAGGYPALFLASFPPFHTLQAAAAGLPLHRSLWLRRTLVILQFIISIFLITGTLFVYRQLEYIRNRHLGFDKKHVLCTSLTSQSAQNFDALKSELLGYPHVLGISATNTILGSWESGARNVRWEGMVGEPHLTFEIIFCDYDFLETFRMRLVEGRFFSRAFGSDASSGIVLNKTAVRKMGLTNTTAIGKEITYWEDRSGTVIGVIEDFHTQPLHEHIQSVIIQMNPRSTDIVNIRIRAGAIPETIAFIEAKWKEVSGGEDFEYLFLEDYLDHYYKTENAMRKILQVFSVLAISISCIGLLGLISFIAQERTKEIGIRKVLGASVPGILGMLSREFVLLVFAANLIAWPAAFLLIRRWLQNFAYRTSLDIKIFLIAGLSAMVLALITVCFQSIRAAVANPVDSLRYE